MHTLLAILITLVSILNSMPDSQRMTYEGDTIVVMIHEIDQIVTEVDITCYEDNSCTIHNLDNFINIQTDFNCDYRIAYGKF